MSLKPMPPEPGVQGDAERYRKDMVAYYATPENWGWSDSEGVRPKPEKAPNGRDAYRERGVLKYLDTGLPVQAPDPPSGQVAEPEPPRRGRK